MRNEKLHRDGVDDLRVVAIVESPLPTEDLEVLLALDLHAEDEFHRKPKDGKGDDPIEEEGRHTRKDSLPNVLVVLGKGFAFDFGAREVIGEGVFVIDRLLGFHGRDCKCFGFEGQYISY